MILSTMLFSNRHFKFSSRNPHFSLPSRTDIRFTDLPLFCLEHGGETKSHPAYYLRDSHKKQIVFFAVIILGGLLFELIGFTIH